MSVYDLLSKVRTEKPLVHHITNWVTIYDCAQIVKSLGASPVMAHAIEEVADMTSLASALVLNIGTLTSDVIDSMKLAAKSANKKGIPVVLDVCGAGATPFRDIKCAELISETRIDIIKGNVSEIAKIAGEDVQTKGVDATDVKKDIASIAQSLAKKKDCTVVVTGKTDTIADKYRIYLVQNGHEMMTTVVGTGCMATSVIGTFAAIEKDHLKASAAALACFGIAAELAVNKKPDGPMLFKEKLMDEIFNLGKENILKLQRITELKSESPESLL